MIKVIVRKGPIAGVFFLLVTFSFFSLKSDAADSSPNKEKGVIENVIKTSPSSISDEPVNLEDVRTKASYLTIKILLSIFLFLAGLLVVKVGLYLLTALSERAASYRFLKKTGPAFQILVWTGLTYIIIAWVFHPTRETLFAFLTASGVAIGFASQDILKNIFGGLMIILDRPFQVGDKIKVGDYYGEVINIGLRTTRIVTPDDSVVSLPNAEVVSKAVSNANSGALDCQVVTEIEVPSGVDLVEARTIGWEAAVTSQYVYLKKPVSVVMIDAPAERTIRTKLKIKAYVVDTRLEFAFSTEVAELVKEEFRKRGWLQDSVQNKPKLTPAGANLTEDR